MKERWTVIIRMSSGEFVTLLTRDVSGCYRSCVERCKRGYFHQKRNAGKPSVVFCIKGDFVKDIRRMGAKRFVSLMNAYDPLNDAVNQALNY